MKRKNKHGKKRVLVAADSIMQLIMIESVIETWNLDVDCAQSGIDFLSKSRKKHYDLILLDSDMPVHRREDLLKQLRSDINYRTNFPIFLIANSTSIDDRHSEATEILTKPLSFPLLHDHIIEYLVL